VQSAGKTGRGSKDFQLPRQNILQREANGRNTMVFKGAVKKVETVGI